MSYAKGTSVAVERSRAEIERLLMKYGAQQFSSGWDQKIAYVNFLCHGKLVAFILPLPERTDKKFTHGIKYGRLQARSSEKAYLLWEQACREKWRALVLVIKAKLEAVETGITTFEQEFMAHIVMPGGSRTLGEVVLPMLEDAYQRNVPLLLGQGKQEHHGDS